MEEERRPLTRLVFWGRFALAALMNAPSVLMFGWREPLLPMASLHGAQVAMVAAHVAVGVWAVFALRRRLGRARALDVAGRVELALGAAAVCLGWWAPVRELACLLILIVALVRVYVSVLRSGAPAPLVLLGSFALVIAAGTCALRLPAATPEDAPIGWLDAAFTATSATCVTGLIVRDTSAEFTRFGQVVILSMIQLGGLGVVIFGGLLAMVMGAALGLRASRTLRDAGAESTDMFSSVRRLIVLIACLTLGAEALGAAALYVGWPSDWATAPGMTSVGDRVFHSVFFAVSAFCNAGFATTPDSLQGLRFHWTSHTVIVGLIALGGIGIPVVDNVVRVLTARARGVRTLDGRIVRFSLHTRLVLATTGVLYVFGFAGVFVSEALHGGVPAWMAALDAHFMSVTTRTAGFDTVAPATLGPLGRMALVLQMFVGGSPGSAAGGVKTVAVAVLALTVLATIRGRSETTVFKRTIPDALVRKAAVLVTLGIASVGATICALSVTESANDALTVEMLIFEAFSACSTVGLSMGATGELTAPGRVVVIVAMFLGRLGPLAVLTALLGAMASGRGHYAYANEGVSMS